MCVPNASAPSPSLVDAVLASAAKIDSADALRTKFVCMAFIAALLCLFRSARLVCAWNPTRVCRDDVFRVRAWKVLCASLPLAKTFYISGAILFAGMAGECLSIPLDLLTSFLDAALSFAVRTPHHIFLTEYMINLTVSGLHVWGCLTFCGDRFNVVAGEVCRRFWARLLALSPEDDAVLASSEGASSHFDVRKMVIEDPGFLPPPSVVRKYALLFSKMFVFSLLARIVAFSLLWASTLVTLVAEPLFFGGDIFFGLMFLAGGQSLVAAYAVAWSVAAGIFLGETQTTSGRSSSGSAEDASLVRGFYESAYDVVVPPVLRMVKAGEDGHGGRVLV